MTSAPSRPQAPSTSRADSAADPSLAAPRLEKLWASAVYLVATLLLGYPALAGQFLINPRSDQYLAGYAFRDFAAQSLKAGQGFPQWNPFLQGGLPYIGAMHGDIFYPTFLLRMALPTDVAMTWEFIIHLFLAGLFTFMFLRGWSIGFYPALIGGLAYMLGGSIAGYASPGHDGKLFVSALLPVALHLLTRGVRDGRRWAWGLLAIVIGLGVLSPHPQLLQYLLLTSGAFALYVAFSTHDDRGKLPTPVALRRLAFAGASVLLGALIGAIQYAPVFLYTPWSPRAGGHDWDTATSYSFPIEETINAYVPQFSGILGNYWGQNGIHLHSDYFGVVVLVLMGAAFGVWRNPSFKRFWAITALVALFWAYGGHTPLFHLILALVPGTKYFRAPSTIIYVTAFAVSVLAAIGAERVLARKSSTRYATAWAIAAVAFAVLMSAGGYHILSEVAGSFIATNYPADAHGQVVDAFAERAAPNASSAIMGAWRSCVFVLLAAGLLWLMATRRVAPKVAGMGLGLLLVVDLWSIERMYWLFSPPAKALFASDPAIDAILADQQSSKEPGRVLPLRAGQGIEPVDPAFRGDELMIHGLRIVTGYHGNELGIYQKMVGLDSGNIILRPQLWRQENVRYLYTGLDDATAAQASTQLGVPSFVKLAGPVRNAAGSMVYAYRIPTSNPAAWTAASLVKGTDEQALGTVLDPRFDPAVAAIAADTSALQPFQSSAPATTPVVTTRNGPGSMDLVLASPAASTTALVVSENYYPGWTATSEGKPLQLSRVNYNLIGIVVPAGVRNIQLRFTDPAYARGKMLTLIALLIAVIATAGGMAAEMRVARTGPVGA